MSSLTETLARLTTLARDHHAAITTQIQLELEGGAGLLIFWDGTAHVDDLPRQTLLRFVVGPDGQDTFVSAWVYSGKAYIWALDEGLSELEARKESRRLVSRISDVESYLTGQAYRTIPRDWWQAPYSALDTETEAD